MHTFTTRVLSFAVLLGAPLPVFAQGLPTSQPEYLLVIREDVKVGRAGDHARLEAGWVSAFERAKSPDYYLAMESMTSTEAWFVIPSASYAALGEMQAREHGPGLGPELDRLRRADGDLLNGWRGVQMRARPDLSAGDYPDMSKQRHWSVDVFRMRAGGGPVFEAVAKAYGAAAKRVNRTIGFRVYQVTAGMPEPTFFVFSSVSGFADFDKMRTESDSTFKEMMSGADEKVMTSWNDKLMSAESYMLSLSPEMSYVPADVRAGDPAFWGKKPAPKSTSTATKTPTTQP